MAIFQWLGFASDGPKAPNNTTLATLFEVTQELYSLSELPLDSSDAEIELLQRGGELLSLRCGPDLSATVLAALRGGEFDVEEVHLQQCFSSSVEFLELFLETVEGLRRRILQEEDAKDPRMAVRPSQISRILAGLITLLSGVLNADQLLEILAPTGGESGGTQKYSVLCDDLVVTSLDTIESVVIGLPPEQAASAGRLVLDAVRREASSRQRSQSRDQATSVFIRLLNHKKIGIRFTAVKLLGMFATMGRAEQNEVTQAPRVRFKRGELVGATEEMFLSEADAFPALLTAVTNTGLPHFREDADIEAIKADLIFAELLRLIAILTRQNSDLQKMALMLSLPEWAIQRLSDYVLRQSDRVETADDRNLTGEEAELLAVILLNVTQSLAARNYLAETAAPQNLTRLLDALLDRERVHFLKQYETERKAALVEDGFSPSKRLLPSSLNLLIVDVVRSFLEKDANEAESRSGYRRAAFVRAGIHKVLVRHLGSTCLLMVHGMSSSYWRIEADVTRKLMSALVMVLRSSEDAVGELLRVDQNEMMKFPALFWLFRPMFFWRFPLWNEALDVVTTLLQLPLAAHPEMSMEIAASFSPLLEEFPGIPSGVNSESSWLRPLAIVGAFDALVTLAAADVPGFVEMDTAEVEGWIKTERQTFTQVCPPGRAIVASLALHAQHLSRVSEEISQKQEAPQESKTASGILGRLQELHKRHKGTGLSSKLEFTAEDNVIVEKAFVALRLIRLLLQTSKDDREALALSMVHMPIFVPASGGSGYDGRDGPSTAASVLSPASSPSLLVLVFTVLQRTVSVIESVVTSIDETRNTPAAIPLGSPPETASVPVPSLYWILLEGLYVILEWLCMTSTAGTSQKNGVADSIAANSTDLFQAVAVLKRLLAISLPPWDDEGAPEGKNSTDTAIEEAIHAVAAMVTIVLMDAFQESKEMRNAASALQLLHEAVATAMRASNETFAGISTIIGAFLRSSIVIPSQSILIPKGGQWGLLLISDCSRLKELAERSTQALVTIVAGSGINGQAESPPSQRHLAVQSDVTVPPEPEDEALEVEPSPQVTPQGGRTPAPYSETASDLLTAQMREISVLRSALDSHILSSSLTPSALSIHRRVEVLEEEATRLRDKNAQMSELLVKANEELAVLRSSYAEAEVKHKKEMRELALAYSQLEMQLYDMDRSRRGDRGVSTVDASQMNETLFELVGFLSRALENADLVWRCPDGEAAKHYANLTLSLRGDLGFPLVGHWAEPEGTQLRNAMDSSYIPEAAVHTAAEYNEPQNGNALATMHVQNLSSDKQQQRGLLSEPSSSHVAQADAVATQLPPVETGNGSSGVTPISGDHPLVAEM